MHKTLNFDTLQEFDLLDLIQKSLATTRFGELPHQAQALSTLIRWQEGS